jgi:hypothetical protein
VTDYGPSCFVEDNANFPVLDASFAVCEVFTGGSSCGWSDKIQITVTPVSDDDVRPFGPFKLQEGETI